MVNSFVKYLAVAACVFGTSLPAAADAAGKVASMSGDPGSVIVTRGGATYSLSQDDPIFSGDRITTRSEGAITIEAYDCTQTLDAESSIVVNADFCDATGVVLSNNVAVNSSTPTTRMLSQNEMIAGGIGAAVLVAAAAGADGDSGSTPTSP